MIELFDTHFHPSAQRTPAEITALLPQDRYRILLMAVGAGFEESLTAYRFAETVSDAWFACGVHPHGAEEFDGDYDRFRKTFGGSSKLKAIGELGLDYFYDFTPRELQQKVFRNFLDMALDMGLPAIVHIRDKEDSWAAYQDAFDILNPFAGKGGRFAVHCFAGTAEWAGRFLELGGYIGVTGMVTFKKADNIREILKFVPADRLLIETDSPYLAPVPFRGKENHPGLLPYAAEFAAEFLQMDIEDFAGMTTANARKFYSVIS